MTAPWCISLGDVRDNDVEAVGAKAASLGELINAGFDVPPGFVVTTASYRLAVGEATSGSEAQTLLMPQAVQEAVRRAYRDLSGGPVAVRSSATAEDLPGATSAGQHDTYLGVEGPEAVLNAVHRCWASLFSERAVAYHDRLRIDPASVAMGVVIQAMVFPDAAGVMFTADPVSGHRDRVVINASPGLGEQVVSGQVTPDHVVIAAGGRITRTQTLPASPVGTAEVGKPNVDPAAISDDTAVRLAGLGRRIAMRFGRPQDIEWAVQDGQLLILQSRAMTALPPAPVALNWAQRAIGSVVLEILPRRPLPMELTAATKPIVAANMMGMTTALTGIRLNFDAILPQQDFIVQQLIPPVLRPTRATPARLTRTVIRGLRGSPRRWRTDPNLATYRQECAELNRADPQHLTWAELIDVPPRAHLLVRTVTQLRVAYMPAALAALVKLRLAMLISPGGASARDVLAASPTLTTAANEELAALANDARHIQGLRELITTANVAQVQTLARTNPVVASWWQRFQHFQTTYGHRETISILLIHDPCWADAPQTVFALIGVLLGDEDTHPRPPTPRAALAPWKRSLVTAAAEGVALREDTHFELTRVMPAVRRAVEEIGLRLAAAGELDKAEDVWMLTLAEVTAWTPSLHTTDDAILRSIAHRRSKAYAEIASTPLIATTTLYPHRRAASAAVVVGTAGGSGTATGRVRIINGTHEFNTLRAGEVLVCSATNPSWTPLFLRAAAVVVDHGGIASHAAIVAREYGIPAIMGAANATTTLHNGQLITVNGHTGHVTI